MGKKLGDVAVHVLVAPDWRRYIRDRDCGGTGGKVVTLDLGVAAGKD